MCDRTFLVGKIDLIKPTRFSGNRIGGHFRWSRIVVGCIIKAGGNEVARKPQQKYTFFSFVLQMKVNYSDIQLIRIIHTIT